MNDKNQTPKTKGIRKAINTIFSVILTCNVQMVQHLKACQNETSHGYYGITH